MHQERNNVTSSLVILIVGPIIEIFESIDHFMIKA